MSEVVIHAQGIGKKYRIRHQRAKRYTALRDVIAQKFRGFFAPRQRATETQPEEEDFWALRDVSFEVRRGQVVGIIGRNGAGKSTLLKILSRITEPSEGRIELRGRVSSLLEVGTGFHPELTGRENIYLNGAILGMTRAEIKRKFEEILAFAAIEKFLDTPVKRYSSGMYVRLAFAVAAHLEPDILVVDEVLAVGDASFQKKCLGKMGDVAIQGRTVLFVSHDMGKITQLCEHGILLSDGKIAFQGAMASVVGHYLKDKLTSEGYADLKSRGDRSGSGEAQFQSVELLGSGARCDTYAVGAPITIRAVIDVYSSMKDAHIAASILTDDGVPVHCLENRNEGVTWPASTGTFNLDVTIPKLQLYPGGYVIDLWIGDDRQSRVDYLRKAIAFQVIQTTDSGVVMPLNRRDGLVFASSLWSLDRQ